MEQPKHHEIVRPAIELVQQLGSWVMNKIVPPQAVEFQPELPFESEG